MRFGLFSPRPHQPWRLLRSKSSWPNAVKQHKATVTSDLGQHLDLVFRVIHAMGQKRETGIVRISLTQQQHKGSFLRMEDRHSTLMIWTEMVMEWPANGVLLFEAWPRSDLSYSIHGHGILSRVAMLVQEVEPTRLLQVDEKTTAAVNSVTSA